MKLWPWPTVITLESQINCWLIVAWWHQIITSTNVDSWWRHQMETFSALLALCAGNSPVSVNSPHKGHWRGALVFSFICAWINDWVNNREAGDLRRHRGHYDVNVTVSSKVFCGIQLRAISHEVLINSLWPSDAIWRQGSRSTLVQVMACCLTAPSHYLNQCWLSTTKVQWCSSEGKFAWYITAISH